MSFKNSQTFSIKEQSLILFPQKAVYWEENHMLIISDAHIGKSGHFRKHGIAVPDSVNESNILRLEQLVDLVRPRKILFLGDLFHSESNQEVERFRQWRRVHASIEMILTIGNHDVLTRFEFEKMGLECVKQYKSTPFIFIHDESENKSSNLYPISGHIHPAIKMKGKGRQQLIMPCFYFSSTAALLPAFGSFTGSHRIKPVQNDSVFPIVGDHVINITPNS